MRIDWDSFWEGVRYAHKMSFCWEYFPEDEVLENYSEIREQMIGETLETLED